VTWRAPPLCLTVPRLAAFTPGPAVAVVTPLGSRTSGQTFRHLVVHDTLLAFKVYTVLPLTRIVPYFVVKVVKATPCFTLWLEAAAAMPPMIKEEESAPTARATEAARKELRRVGNRPPCRPLCMLSSSLLSIGFVPVLRLRLTIGFFPVRPLSLADSSSLLVEGTPPAGNPSRHLGRIDCRRHGGKPGRDAQSDEALLSGCCR